MFWQLLRTRGPIAAIRETFGNYYIMPVDHTPTPAERRFSELARHHRLHVMTPEERDLARAIPQPITQAWDDHDGLRSEQIQEFQERLNTDNGAPPAGVYSYEERA